MFQKICTKKAWCDLHSSSRLVVSGGQALPKLERRCSMRPAWTRWYTWSRSPISWAGCLLCLLEILGQFPTPRGTGRQHGWACYEHGLCDRNGEPGSGSRLFYINSWAMIWSTDHPVAPAWPGQGPFALCDSVKTKPWKGVHFPFRCSLNHIWYLLDLHRYAQILTHLHVYSQKWKRMTPCLLCQAPFYDHGQQFAVK